MFGVKAFAGRALSAKDDQSGAAPVAVMSHRLWQEKYGSDSSVIGSVFSLNGTPLRVVGITPPGFFGDTLSESAPDFFLPLATEPLVQGVNSVLHVPDAHWLDLIGRIEPGVTATSIEAGMRVELKQWLRSHWGEMDANTRANLPQQTLYLSPGGAGITSMREHYDHWLQILMVVSGFVLLIVCANVANLMLVRGIERRQQTALSIALGARASRLVRQALTESILLSLLGGAAGLAIAFAGTRLILHFAFSRMPGFAGVPISPSPSIPVLLFAFTISLITGVAFGIAPAWLTARVDPIGKHFGRSEIGAKRQYEIAGIAKDARYLTYNLEQPIGPFFFLPESQHDVFPKAEFTQGDVRSHFLHEIIVVTKPGSNVPVSALRRALAAVDPNIPVNLVRTLREQVAGQFNQQRLIARLTSFFGVLSLGLGFRRALWSDCL